MWRLLGAKCSGKIGQPKEENMPTEKIDFCKIASIKNNKRKIFTRRSYVTEWGMWLKLSYLAVTMRCSAWFCRAQADDDKMAGLKGWLCISGWCRLAADLRAPGYKSDLTLRTLWSSFPSPWHLLDIPFLLICLLLPNKTGEWMSLRIYYDTIFMHPNVFQWVLHFKSGWTPNVFERWHFLVQPFLAALRRRLISGTRIVSSPCCPIIPLRSMHFWSLFCFALLLFAYLPRSHPRSVP